MYRGTKAFYGIILGILLMHFTHNILGQKPGSCSGTALDWSPPDASFTVEVPIPLEPSVTDFRDKSQTIYTSIQLYGATKSGCTYVVYDLALSSKGSNRSIKDKLGGLEFMIGGDGEYDYTDKYMALGAFNAREIIYSTQNKKGLFIDAGDRIYILGLASENRSDLDSDIAKHFFTSFRLKASK